MSVAAGGRAPSSGPRRPRVSRGRSPSVLVAVFALVALPSCFGPEEIEQPIALYGAEPIEYPLTLWDAGIEGLTVLGVRVTEDGTVDSIFVKESSGHAALDSAAVAGVRLLSFQPGRRDGERVQMWATLPVHFSMPPE